MKKFFIFFTALAVSITIAQAQAVPDLMNYQGSARNAMGQPLISQTIRVYCSIVSSSNVLYVEKRTVVTNQFGLFSIQIGSAGADSVGGLSNFFPSASALFASFPNVNLRVEYVLPNSTAKVLLGESRMATVPYAFYAKGARPWNYTTSGGSATYNTIYPDNLAFNLGLGTQTATEKLHVAGKIRLQDGNQGAGKVLTSDANGTGTWQPGVSPGFTKTGNRVYLVNNNDSVGIGTPYPSVKLHVVGKFGLDDGTQQGGYNLVSDANGIASWKAPVWTAYSNNIGAGQNYVYLPDITKNVGIGVLAPTAKLHVNGTLRFTGNGPAVENNVLTLDAAGNAVWKAPGSLATQYWVPGFQFNQQTVETVPIYNNRDYYCNSKFIVDKQVLSPGWNLTSSYPMQVKGSTHGMAISVNGNSSINNKFVSFFDAAGRRGSIEGQTLLDLENDPMYVSYVVIQSLQVAAFGAEAVACAGQADVFEVAALGAQVIIWGADLGVQLGILRDNVGVAYASGSADYAEWLERANPSEKCYFGDIVYVAGGKISRNYMDGAQMMVISRAPIVLGNMPDKGKEVLYEKVAFMGQVPVKVTGSVSIGDYIVASGKNDGLGYAVKPENITVEESRRMVGVAWSASGEAALSMINTAVGLNTNAATNIIKKRENEISKLKQQINQLSAYLQTKDASFAYTKLETSFAPTQQPAFTTTPAAQMDTVQTTKTGTAKSLSISALTEKLRRTDVNTTDRLKKILAESPQYVDATMKIILEKAEAVYKPEEIKPEVRRMLTNRAFFIETLKKMYKL